MKPRLKCHVKICPNSGIKDCEGFCNLHYQLWIRGRRGINLIIPFRKKQSLDFQSALRKNSYLRWLNTLKDTKLENPVTKKSEEYLDKIYEFNWDKKKIYSTSEILLTIGEIRKSYQARHCKRNIPFHIALARFFYMYESGLRRRYSCTYYPHLHWHTQKDWEDAIEGRNWKLGKLYTLTEIIEILDSTIGVTYKNSPKLGKQKQLFKRALFETGFQKEIRQTSQTGELRWIKQSRYYQ